MTETLAWDVIVVGAGAAGLMAATRAAECGRRTLLLEKNPRPGVKILMSGGTRCNLTHATDARGIVAAYGRQGSFLHSALAALGPDDLIRFMEFEGVPTKIEDPGKVFPVSNQAADVVEALLRRLRRTDAELALSEPLQTVKRSGAEFTLTTPARQLTAGSLIITTGGRSYPGCGTTGDGYLWAAELGHTIVPPKPALTPVTTELAWVRSLQGVTIPDVAVRVALQPASPPPQSSGRRSKPTPLAQARGSFLFTHFGLSGPAILDVSRVIGRHPDPRELHLICDFLPDDTVGQLSAWVDEQCAADGRRQLSGILAERLPRRLVECLAAEAQVPVERRAAEVSRRDRQRLVAMIKESSLPVSGVMGFRKAEVTSGGVSLDEVNSRDLQSKLVPHLFFAGEVLDLDGPIGGYNFQAAFSTGWLAGQSA